MFLVNQRRKKIQTEEDCSQIINKEVIQPLEDDVQQDQDLEIIGPQQISLMKTSKANQ